MTVVSGNAHDAMCPIVFAAVRGANGKAPASEPFQADRRERVDEEEITGRKGVRRKVIGREASSCF